MERASKKSFPKKSTLLQRISTEISKSLSTIVIPFVQNTFPTQFPSVSL